jgi:hypothetical protein
MRHRKSQEYYVYAARKIAASSIAEPRPTVPDAMCCDVATPKLLDFQGFWGSGEAIRLSKSSTSPAANAAPRESAMPYRPNTVSSRSELVVEYLRVPEKIGLVEQVKEQPKQQSK